MKPLWQNFWMHGSFYFFGFSGVSISSDEQQCVGYFTQRSWLFFFPKEEAIFNYFLYCCKQNISKYIIKSVTYLLTGFMLCFSYMLMLYIFKSIFYAILYTCRFTQNLLTLMNVLYWIVVIIDTANEARPQTPLEEGDQ